MKKSILALTILIGLGACKKTTTPEFVATDVTGTMVLKGNLNRNIIVPNGSGAWTSTGKLSVRGALVSVKVNKNELYPNSSASGADIYSGQSDSLGNYAITVRTNAQGVNADITIDGFAATLDTLVNGQLRKGYYASYAGSNTTKKLMMGQNVQLDYTYMATPVVSNPNNNIKTGTAIVTGFVYMNLPRQILTGTLVTLTTSNIGVANRKVYLNLSNDPNTFNTRSYETTTDGNGSYTFTLNTVAAGTANFNQTANIWVTDLAATRDTIAVNNTVKTGKAGVFQQQSNNQNALYTGTIRNAVNLVYTSFVPN